MRPSITALAFLLLLLHFVSCSLNIQKPLQPSSAQGRISNQLSILRSPPPNSRQQYKAPWESLPATPSLPAAHFSGYAPTNGTQIWYSTFGVSLDSAIESGSPPVVFLHGGFANADYWGNQIRFLAEQGQHAIIAVDSRGHGRSHDNFSSPLTYDAMTEDIVSLMDHLHVPKFTVVGWSDGGIQGFDLAMNYSSRVAGVFSYGGSYRPACNNDTAGESPVVQDFLTRAKVEYESLSPTPKEYHSFESRLDNMWSTQPAWGPESFSKIPSLYVSVDAPLIWVVSGDSEEMVTRNTPGEIHGWVWGSSWVQLPSVSHFGFMQDPQTFNVMLWRFLTILAGRG